MQRYLPLGESRAGLSWRVGSIAAEEAGGAVTIWDGGPDYLSGDILAGFPRFTRRHWS